MLINPKRIYVQTLKNWDRPHPRTGSSFGYLSSFAFHISVEWTVLLSTTLLLGLWTYPKTPSATSSSLSTQVSYFVLLHYAAQFRRTPLPLLMSRGSYIKTAIKLWAPLATTTTSSFRRSLLRASTCFVPAPSFLRPHSYFLGPLQLILHAFIRRRHLCSILAHLLPSLVQHAV